MESYKETVKRALEEIRTVAETNLERSREVSLVITKIDEAILWLSRVKE